MTIDDLIQLGEEAKLLRARSESLECVLRAMAMQLAAAILSNGGGPLSYRERNRNQPRATPLRRQRTVA